jgi:hypothetical protein
VGIGQLIYFAATEGGALPSTIEASAPYTPLNVASFNHVLDASDNNIQAAMMTLDDHLHQDSFMSYYPLYTIKDHFTKSTLDPYWSGWSTTPAGTLNYKYRDHYLFASPSAGQSGITCFLNIAETLATGKVIESLVAADSNNVECGLRVDNGSDDTFFELLIKGGVGTYNLFDAAIFYRWQLASGGITSVQICGTFPGGQAWKLRFKRNTTTQYYCYVDKDFPASYTSVFNFASPWTPTRHGVFVRDLTASGQRGGYFHFYATNN